MLSDLFMCFGKGVAEQLTYWAHTYLPFGRWRRPTDEIIAQVTKRAVSYGITSPAVDRRRAYQVARMTIPNRHGAHLADLTPDAYNRFSPTCTAKTHTGKKKIAAPGDRMGLYLDHPQTLAYVMTPPALARLGVGGSAVGTICGVPIGEATPPAGVIASDLTAQLGGKGSGIDEYAKLVAKLHAGPPAQAEEPAAA